MNKTNHPLNPRLFTEEEVDFMIELYQSGNSCKEIYEGYFKNRCKGYATIQGLLSRRIKMRRRGKRIDFDENFFENINTERKAYWLGFIYADGNVFKNRLRIEIQEEDKYLLEELNKDLGSNNKIGLNTSTHKYKGYIINKRNVYVGYCSEKLISDLNKYGVIPNKTFKLNKVPVLPNELIRHFIRGYFDGDGTVYIDKDGIKFGFYGQHDFLQDIKKILVNELDLSNRKIHDKETVSMITFSRKQDLINFYDYIYKDATIYLKRKKEKFE